MTRWGGASTDLFATALNSGGRYNPITDSWAADGDVDDKLYVASPRSPYSGLDGRQEMIVWGQAFTR